MKTMLVNGLCFVLFVHINGKEISYNYITWQTN